MDVKFFKPDDFSNFIEASVIKSQPSKLIVVNFVRVRRLEIPQSVILVHLEIFKFSSRTNLHTKAKP